MDHDGIYKRLFSHPGMVAQLLREFVSESWLDDFDLDGMERLNANFNADTGEERRGDVIWRLPLRSGGDAYLLLMIEFQSKPDRWMALRALTYAGLLWQQLVNGNRLPADGRLPPIFPAVLYNGDTRWVKPLDLQELIGLPPGSPLWQWQPKMRYNIIDEGVYSEVDLAARDTLAALLFRLENCRDPDRVLAIIDNVIDWLRLHPTYGSLRPVFAALAWRLVELEERSSSGVQVSENLLEVRTMLAARASEWKQQWRQEGLQEGLQEGRQNGEAALLTRQLERQFGVLPGWAKDRISAADTTKLEEWGLRLLDAKNLEDVFG
ncbi:MAG TPA: DUF4351 domain-containing protein [Rhodospirillaceae bacterium]|nr:DUF4351 domain-containing protein [Rhodospirillaceae bacterium]